MAGTVAGAAGTDHEVMYMTATVLKLVGRTEGTAAVVAIGNWAAVAHMGLKELHWSSSSSRCLDAQTHQKVSEGIRGMKDEAFHTWHRPGYMCWTSVLRACDRNIEQQ